MSFVPLTGPAVLRPGEPPRDGVVEFSDPGGDGRAGRTVALPVRAALPVVLGARGRDDVHPSVALLCGGALLGLGLVADARIAPDGRHWAPAGLGLADRRRVDDLARARAHDGLDVEAARAVVHDVIAAVVDAGPQAAPSRPPRPTTPARQPAAEPDDGGGRKSPEGQADFVVRLRERVERRAAEHRAAEAAAAGRAPAQLVGLSLRVEADEEELEAGAVRLVLQVVDERDPLHLCEAAELWADPEPGEQPTHGFGDRARTHAAIALRAAADAWPVLDRLLALRVPDEISLDGDELADLLEHGVAALRERGVDVLWPRSLGRDLTTRATLDRRPGPARATDPPVEDSPFAADALFAFSWQVALGGDPLTDDELDHLARAASPVVKLRGAWAVVDPTVARRARRRLIRRVGAAPAVAAALTGIAEVPDDLPDGAGGWAGAEVVVGASLLAVREQLLAAPTREPVPTPSALTASLRDYQRHGLTWLADVTDLGFGACLADDMGLGKTVTLIALHLHRQAARPEAGPTLVVCPASLLGTWESEVRRFSPGSPVRRFHGAGRDLDAVLAPADDPGFVLTTYGTMRRDHAALADVGWGMVVADEAQHVKNARSATARALRTIDSQARVALTGTPVENDLTDLWSILDWLTPGLLGSRQAFRRVWAVPIESGDEPTKARLLADLVGPFLLRRRKSDPGIAPELPPKTETDHVLALTREQVVLYEAFCRDTMERIERLPRDDPQRRGLVLALLTGLKQICNHPAHFLKQSGAARLAGRSQKLDLLDELLSTVVAEGGGVLVFTQYVAMARLLEAHLARTGVAHQLLHGGTPVPEREAMVTRFQDGEVPVFLLSLKAGGTGLTLTQADHVVHLDRWWNPAVEEQATDRAYRIGQTKPVQVHRMTARGTIEERVAALLERKRSVADAVLARGEAALTELSDEDLRDLVTLRDQQRRADA